MVNISSRKVGLVYVHCLVRDLQLTVFAGPSGGHIFRWSLCARPQDVNAAEFSCKRR
jgi:hypothetical protein